MQAVQSGGIETGAIPISYFPIASTKVFSGHLSCRHCGNMNRNSDEIDLFEEIMTELKRAISKTDTWTAFLDQFYKAYSERFDKGDARRRGAADAIAYALFSHVIAMCSEGFRSPGIVEMHAILEGFSRRELARHICSDKGVEIVERLLRRQSLDTLASYLREVGILTDDDVKLASRLAQFRNGIAHRNERPIREIMKQSKETSHFDVWHEAGKVDWIPFQLECIEYMINLSGMLSLDWVNSLAIETEDDSDPHETPPA